MTTHNISFYIEIRKKTNAFRLIRVSYLELFLTIILFTKGHDVFLGK